MAPKAGRSRRTLLWAALFALYLPSALREPGLAVAGALWFGAALLIHIAVHEAGHAVVGRLVGYRIVTVVTGVGPNLVSFRLGQARIELRPIPVGGHTLLATRDPDRPPAAARLRESAAVLAGPLATAALTLWASSLFPADVGPTRSYPDGSVDTMGFAQIMTVIGWWLLITNLVPWPRQTDGAQLWWLLRASSDEVASLGDARGAATTFHHIERGEVDTALDVSAGVQQNTAALCARASALLLADRHEEARALLIELVDTDLPADREAVVANNLAWAAVNLGDPSLLPEADAWSARAIELAPVESAALLSTRGRVLLELGRPAEALEHLDRGLALCSRREGGRADILATRALARLQSGDAFGARADADEAHRLEPTAAICERARRGADLASLDVVRANLTCGPDGRAALGDGLRIPAARATLAGATRALAEQGEQVEADQVKMISPPAAMS